MKIIYLHQYFCTPSMSGGTRSYELARRLVAAGHEVHLVTSNTNPDPNAPRDWYVTDESGIQVHWLPVAYSNHMSFGKRVRAFLRFAMSSMQRAARLPGDVVFATSTPLTIAIPGIYASKRLQKPMVFEVRDLWPEAAIAANELKSRLLIRAARWLEHTAYKHARHIIALSDRVRDGVVASGINPQDVSVIPNGCDFGLFEVPSQCGQDFRSRYSWLGNRPLVLYAGTIGKINRVDYLARVAQYAYRLNPEVRFAVVGSGRAETKVRQLADQLGVLNQNFFMIGRLPKDEMPAVLSATDMAVSLSTPVPELALDSANKVFDAIAAQRPIALNYGGSLTDLIVDSQMGVYLDPHDAEDAARLLVAKLADRQWLTTAGANAGRVGKERFHRDLLAAQLEAILAKAAGITPTNNSVRKAA